MKTYLGARIHGEINVVVIDGDHEAKMLPLCLEYVNHSPTGFNWGYGGSGPAQLAFAILFDHFRGDVDKTRAWYQTFKWKVLADLRDDEWELTTDKIDLSLLEIREELDRAALYADRH